MTSSEWIVHPNRSELGPDKPGRNGHYRPIRDARARLPVETCEARITLPRSMSRLADRDGSVTFAGASWLFVVGAARTFARTHTDVRRAAAVWLQRPRAMAVVGQHHNRGIDPRRT